jgi:hypothetical protein
MLYLHWIVNKEISKMRINTLILTIDFIGATTSAQAELKKLRSE